MLNSLLRPINRLNPIKNPVTNKELRGRMRGARAFVVLTIYLGLVAVFMMLGYGTQVIDNAIASGDVDGGEIGRGLFAIVIYTELFLVMFITPTVTTGAISGEHERQTYDLLRTTLLPERTLVAGKLFSALAYVLLLQLAAIPLQSIALVFGGVTLEDIVVAQLMLVVTAIFFGTVGVYFSATTRRTMRANMATYAIIIGILVFPVISFMIFGTINGNSGNQYDDTLLGVLIPGTLLSLNPLTSLIVTQLVMQEEQALFFFDISLANGGDITVPVPWVSYTVVYLALTVIIFMLTTRRLHKIENT